MSETQEAKHVAVPAAELHVGDHIAGIGTVTKKLPGSPPAVLCSLDREDGTSRVDFDADAVLWVDLPRGGDRA